jgi:hypothetical protein
MALEPRLVLGAVDPPSPELVWMTRAFWICLVLTLPVAVLGMAEMLPGHWLHGLGRTRTWIEFALATPVVLWGGRPFFARAVAYLSAGFTSMNQTLIVVPTYNERENLPRMAQRLLALPVGVDLLVVDDQRGTPTSAPALASQILALAATEAFGGFDRYRDHIAKQLQIELSGRLRGDTGRIKASLTNDPQLRVALGCTKFDPARLGPCPLPAEPTSWRVMDWQVIDELTTRRQSAHLHEPAVSHLNRVHTRMTVPTVLRPVALP